MDLAKKVHSPSSQNILIGAIKGNIAMANDGLLGEKEVFINEGVSHAILKVYTILRLFFVRHSF